MIIDSHAHYAHPRYNVEIPYLRERGGAYAVSRADREGLIEEMRNNGITGIIEPSIGFDSIEEQLALVSKYPNLMWAAVGVHPTRCIRTAWRNRKKLMAYAEKGKAVAIGETGLDYHKPRKQQHRLHQKRWFVYQIKLADRMKLPLILHTRMADRDALKILKKYRSRLHGGVVHCFKGDRQLAEAYISLGFAIGVGCTVLNDDAEGRALSDAVRNVPLTSLLIETDAPFVLPDIDEGVSRGNQRKKLCNSSLILPAVIQRISELRGETYETVEDAVCQNTVRVFNLNN